MCDCLNYIWRKCLCFNSHSSPTCYLRYHSHAGSDDFLEVRQHLTPLAGTWKSLATALGLTTFTVSEIELEGRAVPARCLDLAIEKWLNQDYPHSKYGLPSWRTLVMAIGSGAGGRYPKLAREVAERYPAHRRTSPSRVVLNV